MHAIIGSIAEFCMMFVLMMMGCAAIAAVVFIGAIVAQHAASWLPLPWAMALGISVAFSSAIGIVAAIGFACEIAK